jgi:UDP-glucose 4-epimerase
VRVLVTGGLGYVGSVVALQLVRAGHEVAVLTRGLREHGPRPPGGVVVLEADLLDRERLRKVTLDYEPEGVCHLAGLARVRESFADPAGYFDTNVGGAASLLRTLAEAAQQTGRPSRVVFASAGAVYGRADNQPITEEARTAPTSPYGASKMAAEQLMAYQVATGALGAVSLRCWVIAGAVGPYGDPDRTRLIPKALAVAAGLEPTLAVNGDGSAVREYTHVADVAAAYQLALAATRPGEHRVFNLGSGTAASIRDVIAVVEEVTGREVVIERRPAQNEPQRVVLDSDHIRRELGWRPRQSSLHEMIRDAWEWLRSNDVGPDVGR